MFADETIASEQDEDAKEEKDTDGDLTVITEHFSTLDDDASVDVTTTSSQQPSTFVL